MKPNFHPEPDVCEAKDNRANEGNGKEWRKKSRVASNTIG